MQIILDEFHRDSRRDSGVRYLVRETSRAQTGTKRIETTFPRARDDSGNRDEMGVARTVVAFTSRTTRSTVCLIKALRYSE